MGEGAKILISQIIALFERALLNFLDSFTPPDISDIHDKTSSFL